MPHPRLALWLGCILGTGSLAAQPDDAYHTWAETTARQLLDAHDTNGSGHLETEEELARISCDAWQALDRAHAQHADGAGLRVTFGIEHTLVWRADALGFSTSLREPLTRRLDTCGLPPPPPFRDAAAHVAALPTGHADRWRTAVAETMRAAYDLDQSGRLDTDTELRAVPCAPWKAIDNGTRQAFDNKSFRIIYGFDEGFVWAGLLLGIDVSQRVPTQGLLDRCGLYAKDYTRHHPRHTEAPRHASTITYIEALHGAPTWQEDVSETLLLAYDTDRDGIIRRKRELRAVPCTVWSAMDRHVRHTHPGASLRSLYGFSVGFAWRGAELGVHEGLRRRADKTMGNCGLR
jgi:hypothetical protein